MDNEKQSGRSGQSDPSQKRASRVNCFFSRLVAMYPEVKRKFDVLLLSSLCQIAS